MPLLPVVRVLRAASPEEFRKSLASFPSVSHLDSVAGKQKPKLWYVVILGVAGAGLAFDTFVLKAKAGTEAPDTDEQSVSNASIQPSNPLPVKREPLGAKFDEAESLLEAPAFRRLDAFTKPRPEEITQITPETVNPNSGFASRHKLTAVLSQPSGDLAVVDGLLLRIGETAEGLRLTKIENDGVFFEIDGKLIHLPRARPGLDR